MNPIKRSEIYRKHRPKAISESLNKFSRFHNAPELLIEAGLDLYKRVERHKIKYGEDKNYMFFKKIDKALLHAFNFINDIHSIYERNIYVESENRFLKKQLNQISEELNIYQAIEASFLSDTLDEKVEIVKQKLKVDHEK